MPARMAGLMTLATPWPVSMARVVKGGGGLVWIRSALEMFHNPGYGDTMFVNNLVGWRVESRLPFNVPRPSAVCLVSGLPTS